jgi:hypothetical protein
MTRKTQAPKDVTIWGEIVNETGKAILVRCDEDSDGVWLPKSQIEYDADYGKGDTGVEIAMTTALAEEKGFFDGMGKPEEPAAEEQPERNCNTCAHIQGLANLGDEGVVCTACNSSPEYNKWEPIPGEQDEDAPADRSSPVWVCLDRISISKPLTEEQAAQYGREMTTIVKKINRMKSELADIKKNYNTEIDAGMKILTDLADRIDNGEETEAVDCDKLCDMATEEWVWTRQDPPHDEIMRRKMTPDEIKKNPLPLPLEKPVAKEDAEDVWESLPKNLVELFGKIVSDDEDENPENIIFSTVYPDGTSADIDIPRRVINFSAQYADREKTDTVVVARSWAEENGLCLPNNGHDCSTCTHYDSLDSEGGPCDSCAPYGGHPKYEPVFAAESQPTPDEAEEHAA